MDYRPKGVCAQMMRVEVADGVVKSAEVMGGCNGNLQGICSLIKDMPVEHAIERMEGIKCGFKSTSCPDQLAKALRLAAEQ